MLLATLGQWPRWRRPRRPSIFPQGPLFFVSTLKRRNVNPMKAGEWVVYNDDGLWFGFFDEHKVAYPTKTAAIEDVPAACLDARKTPKVCCAGVGMCIHIRPERSRHQSIRGGVHHRKTDPGKSCLLRTAVPRCLGGTKHLDYPFSSPGPISQGSFFVLK